MTEHKVVILGGGFAGIKCALELQKKAPAHVRIVLISDREHFEYHGALYRLLTGHSPLEVCLPIRNIVNERRVSFVKDSIWDIDTQEKRVAGKSGSVYSYDTLVVAFGAQTNYFHIEGLEEYSHGVKSINDVLRLKSHIHKLFEVHKDNPEALLDAGNIVVVGGGATGVEVAAELALYAKKLAEIHGFDPSYITIELIEGQSRLLPLLPEVYAERVERRLRLLGVNIFLNRFVQKSEFEEVFLPDIHMKTKTLIWTAGVSGNEVMEKSGFVTARQNKALVTETLTAEKNKDVYVLGDAAATPKTGMAQIALYDGAYAARCILATLQNQNLPHYSPPEPVYAIPVGPRWAAVSYGNKALFGRMGWVVRRLADLYVYLSFLPFKQAVAAFRSHSERVESCSVCCEHEQMISNK